MGYVLAALVGRSDPQLEYAIEWAVLQGALGLGVGFSVLLCRFPWIRMLVCPLLGFAAVSIGFVAIDAIKGNFEPEGAWGHFKEPGYLSFAVAQPVLMTGAHLLGLWLATARRGAILAMLTYAMGGLAWGAVHEGIAPHNQYFPNAFLQGTLIGIAQAAGMAGAQAFSGVAPKAEGTAA